MGDIRKYAAKRIKPDEKRLRKQICFAMTAGEYESVIEIAGKNNTSMSKVIRAALGCFLEMEEYEKRNKLWESN